MSLFSNQPKPDIGASEPPQLKKNTGMTGTVDNLSLTGNATQGGGLFGNKTSTTPTVGTGASTGTGLFGNNTTTPASTTTQTAGGGLFGGNATNNTSNNAAGVAAGKGLTCDTGVKTGGLFGGNTNTTSTTTGGGLFGGTTNATTTTTGGGLFGGTTQNNTKTTEGLFGGTTTTTTGGGLFGGATTTTGGGLFGTNTTGTGGGLFGAQNNTTTNQQQQQILQQQQVEDEQIRKVQEFKAQQIKTHGLSLQYVKGIDKMDEFGQQFLWENYVRFSTHNHYIQKRKLNQQMQQNKQQQHIKQKHIPYKWQNPMFSQNFNDEIANYHKITEMDIIKLEQEYKFEELKLQELHELDTQVDFQGIKNTTLQQYFDASHKNNNQQEMKEYEVIQSKLAKVNQLVKDLKNGVVVPQIKQDQKNGQQGVGAQPQQKEQSNEDLKIKKNYRRHLAFMSYILFGQDEMNYNFNNFLLLKTSDFPQDPKQNTNQPPQQQKTGGLFGGTTTTQVTQQQQQPKQYDPKFEFFRQLHGTFMKLTKDLDQSKQKKTMQSIQEAEIQPKIQQLFDLALQTILNNKKQYQKVRKCYTNVQGNDLS